MAHVVLVGGGHSHVQVLRGHLMNPLPDARLTVVVDRPIAVYSGMVPGFVAGQYAAHELEIDVRPLARRAGAAVMVAPMEGIDPDQRRIHLRGRPPIRYDLASINVGSTVAFTDLPGVREHALPTRPIVDLVERIDARIASAPTPCRVVVVGAGAGGVELAFCLKHRLRDHDVHVTLVASSERPLPDRQPRIGERVRKAAVARGIDVVLGTRVREVTADAVLTDAGAIPSDLTLWVTGAVGPGCLDPLPLDERGFVWVDDELRVEGLDHVFAVGDCAVLRSWPEIPKAGVYAVREGPFLLDNLRRSLEKRPLKPYRAQSDFFTILNLGDGTAVGAKWGQVIEGEWVMRWKDHIDRVFMDKFQVLEPDGADRSAFSKGMPAMDVDAAMLCGGCAAKVGQTPLSRALQRLGPAPADPSVRLGLDARDDVVAFDVDDTLLVQNVDAFKAFTDDPWLVGRVAAHNALSDLFAKGAVPRWAMAIVQIPEDDDDDGKEETLYQVLAGARSVLDAEGVSLTGGHTTIGAELSVGFVITGTGPLRWPANALQDGDVLVLTRALGTGVLFHADMAMAGRARGPWIQAAVAGMQQGNGDAARAAMAFDVHAATDVTGFGLGGHLGEMLRASGVGAEISLSALPALPGVLELLARGERSTFHDDNRRALRGVHVPAELVGDVRIELLWDPQTAGGLLFGVAADQAQALCEAVDGVVIGTVCPADEALFRLRS